jgi:hypothetical protein
MKIGPRSQLKAKVTAINLGEVMAQTEDRDRGPDSLVAGSRSGEQPALVLGLPSRQ